MVDVPTSVNTDVVIPSIADVVISTIIDGPTSITADVVMVAIVDVFIAGHAGVLTSASVVVTMAGISDVVIDAIVGMSVTGPSTPSSVCRLNIPLSGSTSPVEL